MQQNIKSIMRSRSAGLEPPLVPQGRHKFKLILVYHYIHNKKNVVMFSIFSNNKNCRHAKLNPFSTGRHCPDCGAEIEISWLILRCAECKTKRKAGIIFGGIIPKDKHCHKCGEKECFVEKRTTLDFYEIDYALISKKEAGFDPDFLQTIQIWTDKEPAYSEMINKILLIPLLMKH